MSNAANEKIVRVIGWCTAIRGLLAVLYCIPLLMQRAAIEATGYSVAVVVGVQFASAILRFAAGAALLVKCKWSRVIFPVLLIAAFIIPRVAYGSFLLTHNPSRRAGLILGYCIEAIAIIYLLTPFATGYFRPSKPDDQPCNVWSKPNPQRENFL